MPLNYWFFPDSKMNHQRKLVAAQSISYFIYFTIGKLILKKNKQLILKHNDEYLVLKYSCLCYQVVCDYWKINLLIFPKPLSLRLKKNDSIECQRYCILIFFYVNFIDE